MATITYNGYNPTTLEEIALTTMAPISISATRLVLENAGYRIFITGTGMGLTGTGVDTEYVGTASTWQLYRLEGDGTTTLLVDAKGTWSLGDIATTGSPDLYSASHPSLLSAGADSVTGSAGDDCIRSGNGNDTINAGAGNDRIHGNDGLDSVAGGLGMDTLVGGWGGDTLRGGGDDDRLFGTFSSPEEENGTTPGPDKDYLDGGDGNDSIQGGSDNDTLLGGEGRDTLQGDAGADLLQGGGGNDLLDGSTPDWVADTLIGGAGNDKYQLMDGKVIDKVLEDSNGGIDQVVILSNVISAYTLPANVENLAAEWGSAGTTRTFTGNGLANQLSGGSSNDKLYGLGGNDRLFAGGGNNVLDGGAGVDTMVGGGGNDIYYADVTGDVIYDAGGVDTVVCRFSASLGGSAFAVVAKTFEGAGQRFEALTLAGTGDLIGIGSNGANRLRGNEGNNALYGVSGNDTLTGGGGNDHLDGGAGNDVLTGGTGADHFSFADSLTGNVDRITDFAPGTDKIYLDDYVFSHVPGTGLGGNLPLGSGNFLASASHLAQDANDYILYDTDSGALYYDADGNGAGAAVQFAVLTGQPAVSYGDFVVFSRM